MSSSVALGYTSDDLKPSLTHHNLATENQLVLVKKHSIDVEGDTTEDIWVSRSEKNAEAAISRLPQDVLFRIFLILARLKNRIDYSQSGWDWMTVTKVCRNWRDSALCYANLWTDISYPMDEDKVLAYLERSKGAELYVVLGGEEQDSELSFAISGFISAHMDRVREFSVSLAKYAYDWKEIFRILTTSGTLPQLRKLALHRHVNFFHPSEQYYNRIRPVLIRSLADSIPATHLNGLSLRGFYLPWKHHIFHGLSELSLGKIYDVSCQPTLSELLDILESCPDLRKLELVELGPRSSPINQKRSVILANLSHLTIDIDYDMCASLLDSLIIPGDITWSITCKSYPSAAPEPFILKLFDRDEPCTECSVTLQDRKILFKASNLRNGIVTSSITLELMRNYMHDVNGVLVIIIMILKRACHDTATRFTFNLNMEREESMRELTKSAWCMIFDLFPQLQSLNICLPSTYLLDLEKDLIAAITDPAKDNTYLGYRFPKLQNLSLTCANFSSYLGHEAYRSLVMHLYLRSQIGIGLRKVEFIQCREYKSYGSIQSDIIPLKPADEVHWIS